VRVLDELEREIERVAGEAGELRRRWRWRRSSMLIVALPLGLAAAAVAATSAILVGDPVKNPSGARLNLNPKAGLGVIVGSGKLLVARAADPDGGPDWALRMVKTSRGLGCVQLGRVVDGKLGVIGRDGASGNDGKFHERGAEIIQQTDCQQTDGAGNVFIAMTYMGLPASGDATGCAPRSSSRDSRPVCPPGSLRTIYYGLLGPEGKAVTYISRGGSFIRRRVNGPDGAYLVVLRTDPKRRNFYYSPGVTPASGLRSVEYRDGSVCHIVNPQRLGGARRCPLKGFVAPTLPPISRSDLATTIRVRVGTRAEYPGPKVKLPAGARPIPAQRRITLTFRARVAADAHSFYTVSTRMQRASKGCTYGGFGPIAKDVTAGTVLTHTLYVLYRCRGTLKINVGYTQQTRPGPMPFDIGGFGNAKVGRATARLR
jgi:hypothetical protein